MKRIALTLGIVLTTCSTYAVNICGEINSLNNTSAESVEELPRCERIIEVYEDGELQYSYTVPC